MAEQKRVGMPGARPFSVKGASAKRPIFVLNTTYLGDIIDTAGLRAAGVVLRDGVAEFEDKRVIGFSQEELDDFLKATGLEVVKLTDSPTKKGVRWLWLRPGIALPPAVRKLFPEGAVTSDKPVTTTDWDGRQPEAFAEIARRILSPVINRPIKISIPHGYTTDYRKAETFRIYLWSSPRQIGRTVRTPAKIWDTAVGCRDEAFGIPKDARAGTRIEGIPIMDGTYAVAELFPDALYVHHDLAHNGTTEDLIIFATLLQKAAAALADPAGFAAALARIAEENAKARKAADDKAFADLVAKSVPKRAKRMEGELVAAKTRARKLRAEYIAAEREVFALATADKKDGADAVTARFIAELDRLRAGSVDLIETIEVAGARIIVHTRTIEVKHPHKRQTHELGRFAITMDLADGRLMTVVNKDRTVRDDGAHTCHSPHVFYVDGSHTCLGNVAGEVGAYLANFEVEAAASLMTAFLQSVNPDRGYVSRLERFPLVADDAKKAA